MQIEANPIHRWIRGVHSRHPNQRRYAFELDRLSFGRGALERAARNHFPRFVPAETPGGPNPKAATKEGDGFRSQLVTHLYPAQTPTVRRHHPLPDQIAATVVVGITVVPVRVAITTIGIRCGC